MTKRFDPAAIERKLHPDTVRATLLRASLFLTAWELLKRDVLENVKGFFVVGFDESGKLYADYEKRVLSKHKNRFDASLLWLVEAGALTEEQSTRFRVLGEHRHQIAHELPAMLVDPDLDVSRDLLLEARDLVAALGRFWGRISVDTDPSFDGIEVDDDAIKSGAMLLMEHLIQIADGAEPESGAGVSDDAPHP